MATEFSFPDSAAKTAAGRAAASAGTRPEPVEGFQTEKMSLSMGPSHPSTHGVLRLQMELDGEILTKADPVVGYLHRGDEKIAENMTYNQFVPYTDRLDYLAPLANNMAYAIAVERLAKLEVPARCQAIRVLTAEMARVSAHLMGLGAFALDVGAWSVLLYSLEEREKLYKLFEELTGARFTTSYTRIGGVTRDVPEGWLGRVSAFCDQFLPILEETLNLLTRNKIFMDRTVGIGVISKADALAYGLTGPNLRGSGVGLDLRKDKPSPATSSMSSMCPSAPRAIATTAISSAAKRCANRCALSGRSSRNFPAARGMRPMRNASSRRRRKKSSAPWKS